jgi:hypothetical protein
VTVDLVSRTGDYEDVKAEQIALKLAYDNCEFQLDDEDTDLEDNLVLTYALDQGEKLDPGLATAIADVAGQPIEKLFPDYRTGGKLQDSSTQVLLGNSNKENDAPPAKCSNTDASSATVKVSNNIVGDEKKSDCQKMHTTYTMEAYSRVTCSFYWEKGGRKYHGKACSMEGCRKPTPKPCEKTPLYVCTQFDLDKSTCGCVVCHECFNNELTKTCRPTRGGSRR